MAKDLDIIQAVKDNDQQALLKLLQKCTKTPKSKIIGNTKKLNINFQDGDGMSALHQAALMSNTIMVKTLLDNGAVSTLRDNKGMIPLHYATWQGMSQPVQLLIQRGSPVNEQALGGETPLHLACQHGHFDVGTLLLNQHADPTICNKDLKTALDLSCEHGRTRVTELLLRSNLCQKLLEDSPIDNLDNNRTTCLHLAARNGHCEIIKLLLQYGMNINRSTLKGTCLHEAAMAGKTDTVRLLLECGVDVNKPDSYDQTALDIVSKCTGGHGMKELKQLLKEASCALYARAVRDFSNVYDPGSLAFKEGDIVSVLEQRADGIWRGCVLNQGRRTKTGVFPANHVVLVDSKVVAQHLSQFQTPKAGQMYSQIPDLLNRGAMGMTGSPAHHRGSCGSSGTEDGSTTGGSQPSTPHSIPTTPLGGGPGATMLPSLMTSYPPPPRSPMTREPSCGDSGFSSSHSLPQHTPSSPAGSQQFHFGKVPFGSTTSASGSSSPYHHGGGGGGGGVAGANGSIPHLQGNGSIPGYHPHHHHGVGLVGVAGGEAGLRGISPAKDSPAHSNRNSAASSDSGRGFSTGHADHKPIHNYVNVHVTNAPGHQQGHHQGHHHHGHHRLSGQSYESGVSLSRQSYHSTSSSSHGSLDRLEDPGLPSTINVTQLFQAGVPDAEVLHAWLHDLGFEEVYPLFLQAGYDMPTISRMTPEDLTAIGITKPAHRKRLKAEIARLHIHDGIPDYRPNDLMEWLHLLGLGAYLDTLCCQGYEGIDDVTDITWEDLEEIGIQKLGHQKKIMLAIDRLKRITQGSKRLSSMDGRTASLELLEPPPPAPPMSTRWSGEITAIPSHVYDHGGGARPKKSSSGDSISTTSSGGTSTGSASNNVLSGEMRVIPLPREDAGGGMAGGIPFRLNLTSGVPGGTQPDLVAIQVKRPLRSSTGSVASDDSNRNSTGSGGGSHGNHVSDGMYKSFHGTPHQRRPSDSGGDLTYGAGDPTSRYPYSTNKMSMSDYESRKDTIAYQQQQQQQHVMMSKDGSCIPPSAMMSQSAHSSIPGSVGGVTKEHIYATPQISPTTHSKMSFGGPGITSDGLAGPLHINTGPQVQASSAQQRSPARSSGAKKIPPPPPKRTHSIREGGSLSDSPGGSPAPPSPRPQGQSPNPQTTTTPAIPPFPQQHRQQQPHQEPSSCATAPHQPSLSTSSSTPSSTMVATTPSLPSTATTSPDIAVSSTITVSASIHQQPSPSPPSSSSSSQQPHQHSSPAKQPPPPVSSKPQPIKACSPPVVSSKPQPIKAASPPVVAAKPQAQTKSPAVAPKPLSPKPMQSQKMNHAGGSITTPTSSSSSSSSSVSRSPAISIPKPSKQQQHHHPSSSSPSLSQSPRSSGILLSSSPGRTSHLSATERLSKSPPVIVTPKLSSSPQLQQGKGFTSLSEKFGKHSGAEEGGKGDEEDQFPDNVSTDSDDFPPPPPPIAMDIITPKIHNYGIPSSRERPKPGFGLATHQRDIPPTQRRNFASPAGMGAGLDASGTPRRINPGVALPKDERASSMLSARLPPDQSVGPGNQRGAGGHKPDQSNVPLIKPMDHQQKQFQAQQQQHQQHIQQHHQTTPTPKHHPHQQPHNWTPSDPSNSPAIGDDKRSESTMSFESTSSSSSIDSNTLPFANENVGTIKQRAPLAMAPTCTTSTTTTTTTTSHQDHHQQHHNNEYHHHHQQQQVPAGTIRPPVPSKKPTLSPKPARPTQQQQQNLPPATAPSSSQQQQQQQQQPAVPSSQPSAAPNDRREGETGNVLCDIDNMLQDLTDELDAMLEEEIAS